MFNGISLPQAFDLVIPAADIWLKSLDQAMQDWNDSPPNYHAAMDASARAQIINKFTYHHAALNGIPYLQDQLQRYWLCDLVVVRVKHLDRNLSAKNYPTPRSRQWNQQIPLPGIPFGRLNFGYRTDVTGTVIQDVFLTLPNGNWRTINEWVLQVRGPQIEPFPTRANMFGDEVYRYVNVKAV